MAKQSIKEKRALAAAAAEEEERLKQEEFKKDLAEKLLKILAKAEKLSIEYSISSVDDDVIIKMSYGRRESLYENYAEFSLKDSGEYDFYSLESIIRNVEERIEAERIEAEKLKAARDKVKALLSSEEISILNIRI